MDLVWSSHAQHELDEAIAFIEQDSLQAAERQFRRITVAVLMLENFTDMGRPSLLAGTRELVIPGTPYVAIYRAFASRIEIVALKHGARL